MPIKEKIRKNKNVYQEIKYAHNVLLKTARMKYPARWFVDMVYIIYECMGKISRNTMQRFVLNNIQNYDT